MNMWNLLKRFFLQRPLKVGDKVICEEWAGPQVISDIYWLDKGQRRDLPEGSGAMVFADLEPLPGGKQIGHGVYLDECERL